MHERGAPRKLRQAGRRGKAYGTIQPSVGHQLRRGNEETEGVVAVAAELVAVEHGGGAPVHTSQSSTASASVEAS